ncbi:hypothetical protein BgiMline_005152 [Biomphalaria glabrata]|uniref:Uncharacterized protein LOC106065816 isoform X1 n=1 Tax=Biomphalaria glabrata TaxID=6526 RepID=A0A9U8EB58_BIOGL|nr:uncharacterized protein LOC106065816 isoform X1 [Biomphalaria glabrata]XP_013080279.2 uncharacterized protein LOC106065816 isoform X1 [Biomphalaria glabrata]XP_013080565.2 uncharacterized protein LOC106065816 isoform X1 [Biomphalaria glabrata]XP_055876325.1 uncharacterized protein LOC106065816 isoform X1 [Biomphalaria glabrata]KAI8765555.1 hypothetical protein BgiMline_003225 [Biomphalaria glabrata]
MSSYLRRKTTMDTVTSLLAYSNTDFKEDASTFFTNHLAAIFKKISLLWKKAPNHEGWAMEKLLELFQGNNIAQNKDLLQSLDFTHFLNSFFEDDNLIYYPDFVMNCVSFMAADLLMSATCQSGELEEVAFKIIRSPLQYWMINKGHRVDVTFTLYRKFIKEKVMLHLKHVNFDVDQAFAHALTSSYNYTRKSAADYFVDLVYLTFQHSPDEILSVEDKAKLKDVITQLVETFHAAIHRMIEFSSDDLCPSSIIANYCQLLSRCAQVSENWCKNFASTLFFDSLVGLMQKIPHETIIETTDMCRDTILLLLKLAGYSDSCKEQKLRKLRTCLHEMSVINHYMTSCDVVYIAGQLLFHSCENDGSLYLELSILPLLVVLGVKPEEVVKFCPSFVELIEKYIVSEKKSKPSGLIKESINNLFKITENVHQIKLLGLEEYLPLLQYLSLKTLQCPAQALPLLNNNIVSSDMSLQFISIQCILYNKCPNPRRIYVFQNIQVYTRAVINFIGISFWQFAAVMDFYVTTVTSLCQNAIEDLSLEILNDVIKCLQLKMVSMDPIVRETAVKTCGDLYLIIRANNLECTEMTTSLMSAWKSLEDKTESVAYQVLEVLLKILKADYLGHFLSSTNCSKDEIICKIKKILLQPELAGLHPVAFNILSKLYPSNMLVRYAEVSLQQTNHLLSSEVLGYIHVLFTSIQKDTDLKAALDSVMDLLTQGWGDLLLSKVCSQDVSSYRMAVSTIESLLAFMKSSDITMLVNHIGCSSKIQSHRSSNSCSEVNNLFHTVCCKVMEAQGLSLALSCDQINNKEIVEEPLHKKAKFDIGEDFDISEEVLNFLFEFLAKDALKLIDEISITARTDNDNSYLDSTKNLPPYELSTALFPSQKCISVLISQEENNPKATKLIFWLVFREIFKVVNPSRLNQEASRSTDEYVRNSSMVIHDVEVLLDKSFRVAQSELEHEFTQLIMQQISALLVLTTKEHVNLCPILKEMFTTWQCVHVLSTERTNIITFILMKRKSLINLPQVDSNKYVLHTFSDLMKSCQNGFIHENSSLQSLLDSYIKTKRLQASNDTEMNHSENSLIARTNNVSDSAIIQRICSNISVSCEDIDKAKMIETLEVFPSHQLTDLNEALLVTDNQTREELKESIDSLGLANHNFEQLFKCFLSILKHLFSALFLERSRKDTLSFLSSYLTLLEDWMISDEYDNDNDPCALDCV